MTAEVAILNRHAVAMAADSAVTVGRGGNSTKVYNTVNKLFMLSKHHPVGVMVYSSAELLGVPVETVIKFYRSRVLKTEKFEKLSDYADSFLEFLRTDDRLLKQEHRERDLGLVIFTVLQEVYAHLERVKGSNKSAERLKQVKESIAAVKAHGRLPEYSSPKAKRLRSGIEAFIPYWKGRGRWSASLALKVTEFVLEALTRKGPVRYSGRDIPSIYTGVVIAGFGESDAFPALAEITLTYSALGLTQSVEKTAVAIDQDLRAEIVPFAQTDQMESFIYGRSGEFDGLLGAIVEKCFDPQIEHISKSTLSAPQKVNVVSALQAIRAEVTAEFVKKLAQVGQDEIESLRNALASLPKEDLAMIAEALINLTIAKRRASADTETVGPPVDVCVISKGDGFIWMKRKHYFDPKLNIHFDHHYMEA